jgi:hypothetical protein
MCGIVLCVLNVCKPREYPGHLMSYVKRKIDLIKKKNERKSNGDSKEPEVNTLVINIYVALPVMVTNMYLFT